MCFRFAVLLLLVVSARAAEIKGKVTNAIDGEALERVEVVVLENKTSTITSKDGEFDIPNLPPGSYTLRLNAVSYRLLTIPFNLTTANEVKEFSITMAPDNFHRTDRVEVHGDVFQGRRLAGNGRNESDRSGDSRDLNRICRRSLPRNTDIAWCLG